MPKINISWDVGRHNYKLSEVGDTVGAEFDIELTHDEFVRVRDFVAELADCFVKYKLFSDENAGEQGWGG